MTQVQLTTPDSLRRSYSLIVKNILWEGRGREERKGANAFILICIIAYLATTFKSRTQYVYWEQSTVMLKNCAKTTTPKSCVCVSPAHDFGTGRCQSKSVIPLCLRYISQISPGCMITIRPNLHTLISTF